MTQQQEHTPLWDDERIACGVDGTILGWPFYSHYDYRDGVLEASNELMREMRDEYEAALTAANAERDELRAELRETRRMFEDLTPGGSEFHDSPRNVLRWIQQQLNGIRVSTIVELKRENTELRAEVQRLKQEQWTPLADGEYHGQHTRDKYLVRGEWLTVVERNLNGLTYDASVALPNGDRLCRLAAQEQEGDDGK